VLKLTVPGSTVQRSHPSVPGFTVCRNRGNRISLSWYVRLRYPNVTRMVFIAMEWVAMMLTHESEKRKRCCQLNRCATGTGGLHNGEEKISHLTWHLRRCTDKEKQGLGLGATGPLPCHLLAYVLILLTSTQPTTSQNHIGTRHTSSIPPYLVQPLPNASNNFRHFEDFQPLATSAPSSTSKYPLPPLHHIQVTITLGSFS
jgi:hypothetical protein